MKCDDNLLGKLCPGWDKVELARRHHGAVIIYNYPNSLPIKIQGLPVFSPVVSSNKT